MKKLSIVCLAVVMAVVFGYGNAFAEASAKVTAVAGLLKQVNIGEGWTTVMKNTIKTANAKDLFINVSAEIGLTTNTKVASRLLIKAISEAEALVKMRVIIDADVDNPDGTVTVVPGADGVTFSRRTQALIAEFAGALVYEDAEGNIVNCISIDSETGAIDIDVNCIEEETLALILDTLAAHSFNYVAVDVPVGLHTIEVQALVDYTQVGDAAEDELALIEDPVTKAYIANGSMTVEEVRMIKDENIDPEI